MKLPTKLAIHLGALDAAIVVIVYEVTSSPTAHKIVAALGTLVAALLVDPNKSEAPAPTKEPL